MRFFLILMMVLGGLVQAQAAVEISLRGHQPVVLEDVYRQGGQSYVAVEDLLKIVGLSGHWDSVAHTYRIRTGRGWFVLSPATSYLRLGDDFYPMQDRPVFIDGRLRVSERFVQSHLPQLAGQPVFFRNLSAPTVVEREEPGTLEQLFGRLLRRDERQTGPTLRAIALDPGHGGLDTGVIAPDGYNEKLPALEVAEKLARLLRMRLGIPVYLSRSGDYDVALEQRLESASRDDVDLWILLHAQASFSDQVRGIDLFIRQDDEQSSRSSESQKLADHLAAAMTQQNFTVGGVFASSRLSLGRGNLPTVLLEIGYLSNPEELKQLRREDYQNRLTQALFDGIQAYAALSRETGK